MSSCVKTKARACVSVCVCLYACVRASTCNEDLRKKFRGGCFKF